MPVWPIWTLGPLLDLERKLADAGQVLPAPLARGDLREPVADDPRPHTAGETFPAGLLLHGLDVAGAHVDDVHVGIAQDDPVPAHEGLYPLPGPNSGGSLTFPGCFRRPRPLLLSISSPCQELKTISVHRFPYLSISPSTMSMLPTAATTSAIISPSIILGSAPRLTKEGVLTRIRKGLLDPSLMR